MDAANKQYFNEILSKYRLGKANDQEIRFLEAYYNVFELNDDIITDENEKDFTVLKDTIKNTVDQRIKAYEKQSAPFRLVSIWLKYTAAALILFFLSFGTYLMTRTGNVKNNRTPVNAYQGIIPGGNKALLILGNGARITLDDARKGEVAMQAGVTITKTADGQLVYTVLNDKASRHQSLQNSISTPKGGQYQVILPDGTKVWLNASSSITYPTVFTGNERIVTLTGEAYFEVVKNKKMPFLVKSARQTIEVLGTHFNINAYDDEAVTETTLLEGSVKVTSPSNTVTISPGEQAVINRTGDGAISKRQVETDKEVAWKNGLFAFNGEDIRSVMRQVSRWYNIDVVYEKDIPKEKYFGEISRTSSLADVFKILELNNVSFSVEGKTVTVSNKN